MFKTNPFKLISCLLLSIFFIVTACNKDGNKHKYEGIYVGTADFSYDLATDTFPRRHSYKSVSVQVTTNELNNPFLSITFGDSTKKTSDNVELDSAGNYYYSYGSGSLAQSYYISFKDDTLSYNYSANCGIPCSEGIAFKAVKIK